MHTVLHAGSETAQTKGGDSGGRTRVAVAGATGYTGQELVRLLARHPSVTVTAAMSSGAAGAATRRLPALAHIWDGDIVPFMADGLAPLADLVFLALPDKILCRPDCAGLCPECGRDLNLEPHVHEGEEVDPRWAALQQLRHDL